MHQLLKLSRNCSGYKYCICIKWNKRLGNEEVTITDTGSVAASDLNTINSATTGLITASVAAAAGAAADNSLVGNRELLEIR